MHSRKQKILIIFAILIGIPIIFSGIWDLAHSGVTIPTPNSPRQIENLNRGLNAQELGNGNVYLSWRLLPSDPVDIAFDVYRYNLTEIPKKINLAPITTTTDYLDQEPVNKSDAFYYVIPLINGTPGTPSENITVHNAVGTVFSSIPIGVNKTASRLGIGDLDGDGSYDFVIKTPGICIDPAPSEWYPSPDTYKLEAYLSNGTFLWQRDLGWDIELGIWYSPFVVFDLNGDGKAEVAAKASIPGGDHRGDDGHVETGEEKLTIYDGLTGEELCSTDWIPRWAQRYSYNSRNLMGVAFLDGFSPFLIIQRGIYDIIKLQALKYTDHALQLVWDWASTDEFGLDYIAQGSHLMHCADVDGDNRDEVIIGSAVIDDTGEGLWSTHFRHCDACYVGDIDPTRPGLEIYYGLEGTPQILTELGYGMALVDAKTGRILWTIGENTKHLHYRGLVSDIDARYSGMECYGAERDYPRSWLFAANGSLISNEMVFPYRVAPAAVYWDATPQRAILLGPRLYDFVSNESYLTNMEGGELLYADILGDWREEIITYVPGELRIYSTAIPAIDRRPCLMFDPIYRADVTSDANGYTQIPMTSICVAMAPQEGPESPPPLNYGLLLLGHIMNLISDVCIHYVAISIPAGILIISGITRHFVLKNRSKKREKV